MKTSIQKKASGKAVAAKKTKAALGKTAPSVTKARVASVTQTKLAPVSKAKVMSTKTVKAVDKPAAKTVSSKKPIPAAKNATAKTGLIPSAPKTANKTKPSRSSAAQTAPAQQAVQTPKAKTMSVTKVETVPSPVETTAASAVAAPDQLVRATRPSARLAQITVPSLPPAVASTAAKSSFLPNAAPVAVSVPFAPLKKDPKLANNWKNKKAEELTDAEILAMPDDEYMNDKQMAYFRLKLTQLKQDILASAGQTTEHLREDTVVVPDPADRATIEEEHALELRTRDRERKLLKKIEQSIQRIDAGDYGFCDETGEAIGVGRLLARPTATLSLEAQQRRELKQKMFGD